MRAWHVDIRNTDTGYARRITMHGSTAAEIRERAGVTIGPDDVIEQVTWAD